MPVHDALAFYLALGVSISLFLVVQYLGFGIVRYLNR